MTAICYPTLSYPSLSLHLLSHLFFCLFLVLSRISSGIPIWCPLFLPSMDHIGFFQFVFRFTCKAFFGLYHRSVFLWNKHKMSRWHISVEWLMDILDSGLENKGRMNRTLSYYRLALFYLVSWEKKNPEAFNEAKFQLCRFKVNLRNLHRECLL